MEKDKQAFEKRKDLGRRRKRLENIGLKNMVIYDNLIQKGKTIDMEKRNPEPTYQGTNVVNFTQDEETLYVKNKLHNLVDRGYEQQKISTSEKPNGGSYILSFDGKTTADIPYNADATTIQNALNVAGLNDIVVLGGDLLIGIDIEFRGSYAFKNHPPIVIDGKLLTKGGNPLTTPPSVDRLVNEYNYYIVQQQGGEQLYAIIKEIPGGVPTPRIPALPFFFDKNYQIIRTQGGIVVQPTIHNPKVMIQLWQKG